MRVHSHKVRGSLLQKVNKICILSVLITDLWLLLKGKVAAAFLHVWLSKIRRHCCQVLCSTFCPMRDREGWVYAISNILCSESLTETYFWVDGSTPEKLLTYSRGSVPCNPLMHTSSMEKLSWFSHLSVCVIKNNNTWGSRRSSVTYNELWDLQWIYELPETSLIKKAPKTLLKYPHTNHQIYTHREYLAKVFTMLEVFFFYVILFAIFYQRLAHAFFLLFFSEKNWRF